MENLLWMEVLNGKSPIYGPFSSTPCLITGAPEGTFFFYVFSRAESGAESQTAGGTHHETFTFAGTR